MRSGTAWTCAELREAARRVAAGENPDAVAASLGRTRNALRKALSANGYSWEDLVQSGRLARARTCRRLRRRGWSRAGIAARFGVSVRTVNHWMQHVRRGRR